MVSFHVKQLGLLEFSNLGETTHLHKISYHSEKLSKILMKLFSYDYSSQRFYSYRAAGYTERIYEVLGWLDMPKETRPDFITLYFDQPDHAGHNSGPESEEVRIMLEKIMFG